MRRPAAAASAVAFVAVALSGCAVPAPEPVVAIALPAEDAWWSEVAGVLQERVADAGYPVEVRFADDDIPTQVEQVDELLGLNPLALVVAPVDATSLTPVLDGSDPAIEVLTVDGLVRDTEAVDGHVAFDPAAGGSQQAISLLQGLGLADAAGAAVVDAPPGPFRLELFLNSPDNAGTEPSYAAAMSVLQPYLDSGQLVIPSGDVALSDVVTMRGDPEIAADRLGNILLDAYSGSTPDAVLAPTDRIARTLAAVLVRAGAQPGDGFPVISGRGAELESLAAMMAGVQSSTLLEDPRSLGGAVADRLLSALAGAPLPETTAVDNGARDVPATLLSPALIHVADIDPIVIGSGYWSRDDLDEAIAVFQLPVP